MELEDKIIKSEKVTWRELQWLQSETFKEQISVAALVESLEKNGMIRGFHIWEDPSGERWILDGHHMKLALTQLEEKGSVRIPDQLTGYFVKCKDRKEAGKFVILFSSSYARLTVEGFLEHLGRFDLDVKEIEQEVNLEAFEVQNLEALSAGLNQQEPDLEEDNFQEEPPEDPLSAAGDFYEIESENGTAHRIFCGDSTKKESYLKLCAGIEKVVLCVTDPPYGVDYDPEWRRRNLPDKKAPRNTGVVLNDKISDWSQTWELSPSDVIYVWHGARYTHKVGQNIENSGFELCYSIIWNKNQGVIGRGDYHWKHESCWYAVRKGRRHNWQGARNQHTVWDIQNLAADSIRKEEGLTGHSTQKPLECMRRPILNNSAPAEWIIDPFAGSGSSLIAAEQTGRNTLNIELNPAYCDMIIKRVFRYGEKKGVIFKVKRNGKELTEEEKHKIINQKYEGLASAPR